MPCTAPVRGKTDAKYPWDPDIDNDPCGHDDYAGGLCKLHWQLANGSIRGGQQDPQTVLLLHADGADGSTVFADSSPNPKTITAVTNAQVDTAQSKFGGSSALFDGSSRLTTPDHADFEFGSGDFTIDFWARLNTVVNSSVILGKGLAAGGFGPFLFYQNGANLEFYSSSDGATWDIASGVLVYPSIPANTWVHIAVTRQGNTFRTFHDGIQQSTFTSALALVDNTAGVAIGAADTGGTAFFQINGWMDEVRLSKGIARWTGNFAPPTAPY